MSLIALMSVGVISLVVWLVLVFLSVTDGIEKNWKQKLTSLNAPIRITPTDQYYNSYYYQIDSISYKSNYTYKNISEKLVAKASNPYSEEQDMEIPMHWEISSQSNDLVKDLFTLIGDLKVKHPDVIAQDYEMGGALMRLRLIRPSTTSMVHFGGNQQSFLTQISYISSFSDQSPYTHSLLMPPSCNDLNHLFYLASLSSSEATLDEPDCVRHMDTEGFQQRLQALVENSTIERIQPTEAQWQFPIHLFPKTHNLIAFACFQKGRISHFLLPSDKRAQCPKNLIQGSLLYENGSLQFRAAGEEYHLAQTTPIYCNDLREFNVTLIKSLTPRAKRLSDLQFMMMTEIQGLKIEGNIPWVNMEITKAHMTTHFESKPQRPPPWSYAVNNTYYLAENEDNAYGVVLPQTFQDSGVKIGDQGYLSYGSATASSMQEQRLPIYVGGFYDPGIMAIGAKFILAPMHVVHDINLASNTFSIDQNQSNGINVWFKDINETKAIAYELKHMLDEKGLTSFWNVTTFHEYDFSRDLLQQFQSDKYLFSLIAMIILTVACCNIISLLVLLVNDKKHEIGILQSMGAKRMSIAMVFALCGGIMGIVSTLIGTVAAIITLHNIDALVGILSFLQGHEAFNPMFYGHSLPSHLSSSALKFILISTPIISIIAGLFPAIKACKLEPATILRIE